jgi:hypothetical protein
MPKAKVPFSSRFLQNRTQSARVAMALVLVVAACVEQSDAVKLKESFRKRSVSVRLVGRAAPLPTSTFGANYDSYVAVLQAGNITDVPFVKLVYRFMDYDRSLPRLFMDYEFVHRFRALRQPDCDEPAEAMLYSLHLTRFGELLGSDFSFEYAKNATEIVIPATTILPCYVVAPTDYKGSHRVPARPSASVTAEDQSDRARAPKTP